MEVMNMASSIKNEISKDFLHIHDDFDSFLCRKMLKKRFDVFEPASFHPKIEVLDKKDIILVKAEIPGINKKDIKVSFERGNLIIQGEIKKEEEKKEQGYYYSERSYGSFSRTIPLPSEIDEKSEKVDYKDGILDLRISKVKTLKLRHKEIEVK